MYGDSSAGASSLPPIKLRLINPSRHGEREHLISVDPRSTVKDLKLRLVKEHAAQPSVSEQRLFFHGRQLSDDEAFLKTLASEDPTNPIAIHLHIPRSRSNSAASPRPSPLLRAQSTPAMPPRSPLLPPSARRAPLPAAATAAAAASAHHTPIGPAAPAYRAMSPQQAWVQQQQQAQNYQRRRCLLR